MAVGGLKQKPSGNRQKQPVQSTPDFYYIPSGKVDPDTTYGRNTDGTGTRTQVRGNSSNNTAERSAIPIMVYIAGGVAVLAVIAVLVVGIAALFGKRIFNPGGDSGSAALNREQTEYHGQSHAAAQTENGNDAGQDHNWYNESPEELRTEAPAQRIPEVGETVAFGSWDQDGDANADPIEWVVLDRAGDQALLITRQAIERNVYSMNDNDVKWENSWMRSWLNDSFYHTAFSGEERQKIVSHYNPACKNTHYPDLDPGRGTNDYIFLLSFDEALKYYGGAEIRKCGAVQKVVDSGAFIRDGACWWWLRTPGCDLQHVMGISTKGQVHFDGIESTDYGCIRPAMWVDFS